MAQSLPSRPVEVTDGVQRQPRTGIKIVISGAGIGGMFAALECWRKGIDVEILEQNDALSSLGDFFAIGPSALSTLHYYPTMLAEYNKTTWNSPIWWCSPDGRKVVSELPEWNRVGAAPHAAKDVPIVGFMKLRSQVMKMLEDQIKRLSIPILYGHKVANYEEDGHSGKARVITTKGEVFTGDVVVAAEGIGTKSHEIITGHHLPFVGSGYAVIRGAFSPECIAPGSRGAELLLRPGQTPEVRTYAGENMHLLVLLTHDKIGVAFTHKEDGSAKESWANTIPAEELVAMLSEHTNWGEQIMDFVKQVPSDALIDWKLTWRDPQPVWASKGGRIVQLGDSAHAFLPSSGNGATQAMEDGISLAECLYQGGSARVSWAVKVHTKLRYQRVSVIQRFGIVSRQKIHHIDMSLLDEGKNPFEGVWQLGRWMWQHKPEDYARENFAAALGHLQEGKPFENTNLPKGHIYEDWNVESELKEQAAGIISQLMSNGDWSI
ncbi:FAD/NAD(P)-binding domain-containing protein [Astrocystis sublimbata]|nr:FAD/NAD(P)-binding domain-containing protein [Astrocystis sublimbata]